MRVRMRVRMRVTDCVPDPKNTLVVHDHTAELGARQLVVRKM